MSVPEPERHKGRMEVHVKAQALAVHTAKIVSNPNVFNPENDPLLIEEIKHIAYEIYAKAWTANKIRAEANHVNREMRYRLQEGVYWLGYLYRLTDTGKVVRTVDPVRVKSARRKYKRLVNKYFNGELPRAKVDESYQCWRNHASKGDGWKMLRNMDNYYQQLWRDADAKNRQKDVPLSEGRGDKPPTVRA